MADAANAADAAAAAASVAVFVFVFALLPNNTNNQSSFYNLPQVFMQCAMCELCENANSLLT